MTFKQPTLKRNAPRYEIAPGISRSCEDTSHRVEYSDRPEQSPPAESHSLDDHDIPTTFPKHTLHGCNSIDESTQRLYAIRQPATVACGTCDTVMSISEDTAQSWRRNPSVLEPWKLCLLDYCKHSSPFICTNSPHAKLQSRGRLHLRWQSSRAMTIPGVT